jgi:hypothetical protein
VDVERQWGGSKREEGMERNEHREMTQRRDGTGVAAWTWAGAQGRRCGHSFWGGSGVSVEGAAGVGDRPGWAAHGERSQQWRGDREGRARRAAESR